MVAAAMIKKHESLSGSKKRCIGHTLCSRRGKYSRDEDGNLNFHIDPKSLKDYYGQFSNSRLGRLREEALSYLVEALSINVENEFVEAEFVTLLHQLLNSVKKGCGKERLLASHVVGLLAITVSSHEYAHTVYEDSLSVLSQALEHDYEGLRMLECLGIVTFFGSANSEETQIAMQIIWKYVCPANKNITSKPVLAAAITAWPFLLSTVDGWRLNHKSWRRAVSRLSNLLDDEEELVRVAAGEALALILETESIEKFSGEINNSLNEFKHEVKENIVNKLTIVEDEHSAEILRCLEDGYGLGAAMIGEDGLVLSSLSQIVQLNFLKNFLGENEFATHMMENNRLRNAFELTTMAEDSSWDAYADCTPIREEIVVHFYQHEAVRQEEDGSMLTFVSREEKQLLKRMTKSPNSYLSKARTKVLNKNRIVKNRIVEKEY
ncbi:putative Interferon-related developmental regulator family protein / IFRD family protein [Tripterygium wilfordii]|uniref:Putative Interferon-related developmental regulator family protein / IFRD family protein n=1 Tax=Tripterygium wilfordii TaxID=458696 RepID=A0A7J7DUX5_TRIWF|nr:uncharacterized protein LOC119993271 [Tripterygium wilfordii]KAF5749964.1 putative Interferon-related developmental regulator family protein / IFRD family protein [Tripterygium wilfordii]